MVYFIAGKSNCCQSYGKLSNDGWTENRPKNDILLDSNSDTIEGIDLKLIMLYHLYRHYAQTKFHPNLKGSIFFCVDLAWKDPSWNHKIKYNLYTLMLAHIFFWRQLLACCVSYSVPKYKVSFTSWSFMQVSFQII